MIHPSPSPNSFYFSAFWSTQTVLSSIYFITNRSLSRVNVCPQLLKCFNVMWAIRRDAHSSVQSRGTMRFSLHPSAHELAAA